MQDKVLFHPKNYLAFKKGKAPIMKEENLWK